MPMTVKERTHQPARKKSKRAAKKVTPLAAVLCAARAKLKLSQQAVATAGGLSANTYRSIEHGAHSPRAATLERIAVGLRTTVKVLQRRAARAAV